METTKINEGMEMKAGNTEYYEQQLSRINLASEYCPIIKVYSPEGGRDTNAMDLNEESAKVLIEWLNEMFIK